jgi:hypothetical protein
MPALISFTARSAGDPSRSSTIFEIRLLTE